AQVLIGSEDPTLYQRDDLDWLNRNPGSSGTQPAHHLAASEGAGRARELAHIVATSAGADWTPVTELTALSVPTSGFQSFPLDTAHTSDYAIAEYSAGPRGGDVAGIGLQDPSGNVWCLTYSGGYILWEGPPFVGGSQIHTFSSPPSTT